jgi:hypothetical protein
MTSLNLADEKIRRLEENERILLKKLTREEEKHKREMEIFIQIGKDKSSPIEKNELEKIVEKYERKIIEIQKEGEIFKA